MILEQDTPRLASLLEIPADVVKIDKSFTDRINLKEQRNFVSQMGNFIHSAKEEVIFEGLKRKKLTSVFAWLWIFVRTGIFI